MEAPKTQQCKPPLYYRAEPKENWHKHNKQRPKRVPVGRKEKRKGKKFDSTKGYPGEGPGDEPPPRRGGLGGRGRGNGRNAPNRGKGKGRGGARRGQDVRPNRARCLACGVIFRGYHDCQREQLEEVKGMPAEVAANLLDPRAGPALDVPAANHPDGPPQPQEAEREEEKKTPEQLRDEYVADLDARMFELASARLARPGVITPADEKVIKGAMSNIARFQQSYKRCPNLDISWMVNRVYTRALSRNPLGKIRHAGARLPFGLMDRVFRVITRGERPQYAGKLLGETPYEHVQRLEQVDPCLSVPDRKTHFGLTTLWTFRTLFMASAEELVKRAVSRVVEAATRRSNPLVIRRIWPFQVLLKIIPAMVYATAEGVAARQSLTQTALRVAAHATLALMPLKLSVAMHTTWNLMARRADKLDLIGLVSGHPESGVIGRHEALCLANYDMKMPEQQPGFTKKEGPPSCRRSFGTHTVFGVEGFGVRVYANCTCNERISLAGRVGKLLPCHRDPDAMGKIEKAWLALEPVSLALDEIVLEHAGKVRAPYNFEAWVKDFPPAKRDMFKRIKQEGLHTSYHNRAKAFIKVENKAYDNHKPLQPQLKDPRMIQGCPPELSVQVGPYIRKAAKRLRDGLRPQPFTEAGADPTPYEDVRGQFIYTCGLSNEQIGHEFARCLLTVGAKLDADDSIVIFEDDQSRFDLHMLPATFRMLNRKYKRLLARKAAALLRRKELSHGITRHRTKYSIPGTMQSGYPDTSYGDTATNEVAKAGIFGLGNNWLSIVCGDDSVTVMSRKLAEDLGGPEGMFARYAELGLEATGGLKTDPLDVEFCSGRFHPMGESFVLMPKPGKLLARLGTCRDDLGRNNLMAWLRGIGNTAKTFGGVDPLLAALSLSIQGHTGDGRARMERSEYGHKLSSTTKASQHDILTYYAHHYGMRQRDVSEAVQHILDTPIGTPYTHPYIKHMAHIDT